MQKHLKMLLLTVFGAILGVFTLYSLIATCYIDKDERIYYGYSSILDFILFLFFFILIFFCYRIGKRLLTDSFQVSYLVIASLLLGSLFVLLTQLPPKADQEACVTIAEQMHLQDFSAFLPGNYMHIYPQQSGLVLFYYLLGFIVGTKNIIFLQLLNVVAYSGFIYTIYLLTMRLFYSKQIALCASFSTMLFLPLLFYTSFLYGTMIGLTCSTYAIVKALDYIDFKLPKDGLLCILFLSIAVVFKKNFLIPTIAIVLMLLLYALFEKHKKTILLLLLMTTCMIASIKGPVLLLEQVTDTSFDDGIPAIAWVTMGLQESWRGNGWYNGYTLRTYQKNNCDSSKTAAVATSDLSKQISQFVSGKENVPSFFFFKLASEWNEPSFECFRITDTTSVKKELSPLSYLLVQEISPSILLGYFNLFLSIIYLGAFLFICKAGKRGSLYDLIPLLIFLGGFIFHLFWEAKGQYTICYFVLLIPYAVKGYAGSLKAIEGYLHDKSDRSVLKTMISFAPVCLTLATFSIYGILRSFFPSIQDHVVNSNADYLTYINTADTKKSFLTGTFRLRSTVKEAYLTFLYSKDGTLSASLSNERNATQALSIAETSSSTIITVDSYELPLTALRLSQNDTADSKKRKNIYQLSPSLSWRVVRHSNSTYSLCNSYGYAITRTTKDMLLLAPYDSMDSSQQWLLED